MPPFERHVFVCTNQRPAGHPKGCCSEKGSEALREAMKAMVKQRGLADRVRVNVSGCLDQCEHGITIVVYPDGIWYGFVQMADVEEIVESHLIAGKPVERLRLPNDCVNTPTCMHRRK